jgi:hypothetical protein
MKAFASGWDGGVNWMTNRKANFERVWKEFLEKEFDNEEER